VKVIDVEKLRRMVHYNPDNGEFTWLPRGNNQWTSRWAGKKAGNLSPSGYVTISVDGIVYKAHRLAWAYMTGENPEHEIDHADLDKTNNAWSNLRSATPSQNKANKRPLSTNTSGFKGVFRGKPRAKPWRAAIMVDGKRLELGHFLTKEDAASAYNQKARELRGEFARVS